MLYIDQPVGTGYSHIENHKERRNDRCIAKHFYTFLKKFLTKYNLWEKEILFSGESHAGHYIPILKLYFRQTRVYYPKRIMNKS